MKYVVVSDEDPFPPGEDWRSGAVVQSVRDGAVFLVDQSGSARLDDDGSWTMGSGDLGLSPTQKRIWIARLKDHAAYMESELAQLRAELERAMGNP